MRDAPPTAPPPEAQPGTVERWTWIEKRVACSPPDNAPLCVSGTVRFERDGSFAAPSASGQISESDLSELVETGDAVTRQDLIALRSACEPAARIPELRSSALVLSLEQASAEAVVLELKPSADQRCVLGDPALAARLDESVDRLIRKYLP